MGVFELVPSPDRPLPEAVSVGVLVLVRLVGGRFEKDEDILAVISDSLEASRTDDVVVAGTGTDLAKAIIGLREGEEREVGGRCFRIIKIKGIPE